MEDTIYKVPTMAELASRGEAPEVLFWVGCAGSFDDRYKRVTKAFVKILHAVNIKFAVLGTEESCTGDPARRAGNEFLFQMQAMNNIQVLNNYAIKKIVTACPHCFNTFRNEYPQFGGDYQVYHHSEFLAELVDQGRIKPTAQSDKTVTYHDPCYLGRYAGKVDEPRDLLVRFGADVKEPVRNRENPYCCGAGGGLLFADKEEEPGSRISDVRFKQLQDTGAETVVTACPFCSIMLKGAQSSAPQNNVQFVDLMTFVNGRLNKA